jgi:hypothetical protein
MRVTTLRNKETGEQYAAAVKVSWGKKYYSLDSGDTWFPSSVAARQAQPEAYCAAVALAQKFVEVN